MITRHAGSELKRSSLRLGSQLEAVRLVLRNLTGGVASAEFGSHDFGSTHCVTMTTLKHILITFIGIRANTDW